MMDDFQQKKNSSMVDFAPFSFEMFAVGYNRKTDWLAGWQCVCQPFRLLGTKTGRARGF